MRHQDHPSFELPEGWTSSAAASSLSKEATTLSSAASQATRLWWHYDNLGASAWASISSIIIFICSSIKKHQKHQNYNYLSAWAKASTVSMSRWFVGSSMIRQFGRLGSSTLSGLWQNFICKMTDSPIVIVLIGDVLQNHHLNQKQKGGKWEQDKMLQKGEWGYVLASTAMATLAFCPPDKDPICWVAGEPPTCTI